LATVVIVANPHGQLFYTGAALAVYLALVCRFWPWLSGELSAFDAVSTLILLLVMLTAAQFLGESTGSGRSEILAVLMFGMAVLIGRFVITVIRSVHANGIFGEFGRGNPDRMTTSREWLQWLEYIHDVPNETIIETICKMNGFDRYSIVQLMSSWNAIDRRSIPGQEKRLSGGENRVSVNKARTSRLSRQSSRSSRSWNSNEIADFAGAFDASNNLGQDSAQVDQPINITDCTETDSEMSASCMI